MPGLGYQRLNLKERHMSESKLFLGHIDPLGNFMLAINDKNDPCKSDTLGFFKKIAYSEKLNNTREALISSLGIYI